MNNKANLKNGILDKAFGESELRDWYMTSVSQEQKPIWTDEHIIELLKDFILIPKNN